MIVENRFGLVSIIVPVHNAEKYLHECISGILKQSYTDMEILLVDDGSTDSSGEICERFAAADPRVSVLHNDNAGPACSRNSALDQAKGEWIMFVDSDDYIDSDLCENVLKQACDNKADIVVFGFNKVYGNREERCTIELGSGEITKEMAMSMLNNEYFGSYVWNKIYKKCVWNNIRMPEGCFFEDVGTQYKLFEAASALYFFDCYKYHYRQHKNSIMHKKTVRRFHDNFEQLYIRQKFFSGKYEKAYFGSEESLYRAAAGYCLYSDGNDDPNLYDSAQRLLLGKEKLPEGSRFRTVTVWKLMRKSRAGFKLLHWIAGYMIDRK